jgi:hypothetical protein
MSVNYGKKMQLSTRKKLEVLLKSPPLPPPPKKNKPITIAKLLLHKMEEVTGTIGRIPV